MISLAVDKTSAQFSTRAVKGRRGRRQGLASDPSFLSKTPASLGKVCPLPVTSPSLRSQRWLPARGPLSRPHRFLGRHFLCTAPHPNKSSREEREGCDLSSFIPPEFNCGAFQRHSSCPWTAQPHRTPDRGNKATNNQHGPDTLLFPGQRSS